METDSTADYDVEAVPRENRLYIDLDGRLSAAEIAAAAGETEQSLDALDEDFDVVNDLSGFRPPRPEAAAPIKDAQAAIVDAGVGTVVRVTDESTSDVVVNAFKRRSRDVGYTGESADSKRNPRACWTDSAELRRTPVSTDSFRFSPFVTDRRPDDAIPST